MTNVKKRLKGLIDSKSVVVIGLGNPDRADDRVGIEVAKKLKELAPDRIFLEQDGLEGVVLDILNRKDAETVLFIDAVDFDGRAGEIQIFSQATFQFRRISTHKVSLELLSALLRKEGKAIYLLGIQPSTLDFDSKISDEVKKSLEKVVEIFTPFFNHSERG